MENFTSENEYSIIFSHVQKAYGKNVVIEDLNLEIKKGERLILLGPSGCGKTTTLRMIAGFEEITLGDLFMDGQQVNDKAPGERNIAMVFQSYALFPHMTVWENITFGLQLQKLPVAEIESRTREALEILHLEGYENKKTHELSGGQKQRVALARALVKQSPYFLLDEPLSNLDAKLRQKARTELVKIHEMFKPTMVYVTHDQIEAMTVAHRIAVMNQGRIQQIDTPYNIYHHPANTFVAGFIGSPAMNIIEAEVLNGKLIVGKCVLTPPCELLKFIGARKKISFGLRPEACTPTYGSAMITGKTEFVENTGNLKTATLRLLSGESFYVQDSHQDTDLAACSGFDFAWENVCLFDLETGDNLELGGK
ncbi:MAG: ABC transporter ATP-binding protein [Phascolarctobacterium sp.]|nr:ABC transporter ATP-binding protein [Phascolarctobacterium sp.]